MPANHVPHERLWSVAREPTPPSRVGKGVGGLGPDVRAQTAVEAPRGAERRARMPAGQPDPPFPRREGGWGG